MDSGNEVIVIEGKLATTNGINGNSNYEEAVAAAADMKTRSKVTEGGGAPSEETGVKPKLRSTRTASANVQKNADEKSGSDADKKDKKSRSAGEADATSKGGAAGGDAKASGAVASKKTTAPTVVVENTPSKRKGDDDSGINSRSSSVSNEDTYSSRMRTRSKTAEALSSSTPASTKKGASRMPLSTYDFEDISFDEDPSTSANALKRKATMYVEEMEDEPEETEPPAKRVVPYKGAGLLSALLYPFRAIRGKISIGSQTEQTVTKDDAASQTHATKASDVDPEKEHVASQTETEGQTADDPKTPGTCAVM